MDKAEPQPLVRRIGYGVPSSRTLPLIGCGLTYIYNVLEKVRTSSAVGPPLAGVPQIPSENGAATSADPTASVSVTAPGSLGVARCRGAWFKLWR